VQPQTLENLGIRFCPSLVVWEQHAVMKRACSTQAGTRPAKQAWRWGLCTASGSKVRDDGESATDPLASSTQWALAHQIERAMVAML